MKKALLLTIAVIVFLAGCGYIIPLPQNPFYGTWTASFFGTVTYVFRPDMTLTIAWSGDPEPTECVYSYTDTRLTLTYDDGSTSEVLYSISGDALTLTPETGGISLTLVRQ